LHYLWWKTEGKLRLGNKNKSFGFILYFSRLALPLSRENDTLMKALIRFVKNWTLPIAIVTGMVTYFVFARTTCLAPAKPFLLAFVEEAQPLLIFVMLFLTFCKIDPKAIRLQRWHIWLIAFQILTFAALATFLFVRPATPSRLLVESAMLCLICPTATAAPVVTNKLGGDSTSLTGYLMLINLVTAVMVPLVVPLAHPQAGINFLNAFLRIMSRVFPMLIVPLLAAWLVRVTSSRLLTLILKTKDLPFYLWSVCLSMAIALATKSFVHAHLPLWYSAEIGTVSFVCCIAQFVIGKKIGARYGQRISGGQALGQKNTAFGIWMGYTFLSPITSVAGGFYAIWHNLFNTWQLWQKRKQDEAAK
jgi:BASS family bile acid:Na+ symporter